MRKMIDELTDGYRGELTALILQVARGVTAKGAPYLSFQLQDRTGRIDAKYWNVGEAQLYLYEPGMIVKVKGDVLSHQKQLQYRINAVEIVEQQQQDLREFVKEGPIDKAVLKNGIYEKINSIGSEGIRTLSLAILEEHEKSFFEYPAAKRNHHDFVGGLATHVYGMMCLAEAVCMQYPSLDRDLLISGVLLHDIGKLTELSGAVIAEYTREGKLLGHISIMQGEIQEKARQLGIDEEEALLLRHMVLSHHGKYEYGSPVLPMIPEAEMLYLIDNIDARMNTMEKALSSVEEGEFTPRIFALESRSFYKRKKNKTAKEI